MRELVENILSCSMSPSNWDNTLDIFNREFGVTSSVMFDVSVSDDFSSNFHMSEFNRPFVTPDIVETLKKGSEGDDRSGYQFLFTSPPQQFYTEVTMFGVNDYDELPSCQVRGFLESLGFVMRVSTVLNRQGPWIDGLFCQCKSDTEWKNLLSDDKVGLILPIMGNSFSLGRMLQALRAQFKASLSVLDALGIGVFLVDQRGFVIEKNKEAARIIDGKDGISLNGANTIKLATPDKTSELNAMISAANGLFKGEMNTLHSLIASGRPSGAYDYLISVRSLSDSQGELETGFKCAFVTVIDPERENALSAEGIAALGQLSDAESEVVNLLVQGFRPAEVAERRDVSLPTVKTQLRTIFDKLRCSGQSDVIRIAAATRLPIEKD